ncbi:3'5'-cyclic nucleotide phosphodiesterase, catalytic domain protein [Metarhizium album ARSEF 1941]|uniref:Phosphodiesterase n=1 Tax=Metarhizium album (strain ARSEF 1941) TaxID=1081103 RepID=A0A0B2WMF8_METAS|nr:3'5'-cyclic nucleotide phosphodiesterase, catalytic domain protein [Metarhizium album ARSEF 1941]KHN95133.1 3'5'-cyclic nucleotide phosphodiesterase, catalytic domain protein [Metarhizium album ARSEF 1941]
MDRLSCNVIYVNRLVGEDRLLGAAPDTNNAANENAQLGWNRDHARELVQPLLDTFGDDQRALSGSSPSTPPLVAQASEIHTPNEELYGLGLLQKIITEAHLRNISKLVVPVAVISHPETTVPNGGHQMTDGASEAAPVPQATLAANRQLMRTCLDLGAVDVLISPLSPKCTTTLEICAYKAHRDAAKEQQALMAVAKGRKRSWVGVNEQKPFAYLREAMVSGLMNGICRLDSNDGQLAGAHIAVSSTRQVEIADAVGRWHFCAHSFSDDELLVAALIIFKHALAEPELEPWRIPADQLISYLVACRAAYNSFVPYHNFRHVVDVLQATFNFLVHIGALAPYPLGRQQDTVAEKSPIAALLGPFEALTLLVTAIGHDVGHPGVNNGFLATLNAPLAQLYNDRSVLESFHCAAYSQILRRYWPSAFEDRKMRSLMISSILATDMGLHFDYMKKLGDVQERVQDNNSTDGWNGRQLEDSKALACSLLIKCADISNVARHHDTALKWMHILSEEFSRQASMEDELDIKSSLMAQPKKDILSLSNAQLGFMNMFAMPLFQGVADIMPAMRYTVVELEVNKRLFEQKVQQERARQSPDELRLRRGIREGAFSPRTRSLIGESDKPEGQAQAVASTEPVKNLTDGATEVDGDAPRVVADVADRVEEQAPTVTEEPADSAVKIPPCGTAAPRQDLNGTAFTFDAVRELAESDPFNCRSRGDSGTTESKTSRQRCSETTEGSASGATAGDWHSQATTATTGKLALSPSTQGTSIVSNESVERTLSATGLNVSPPSTSSHGSPGTVLRDTGAGGDESSHGGSIVKAEGKSLRKKSSRFRMKDFPFFRRSKASSPPLPASDATT